jgi:hypothetical protein
MLVVLLLEVVLATLFNQKIVHLLILFFLSIPVFGQERKVCLNMIVKDEAAVIERCLGSIKDFIDYWVIVDTGSTDGTQEKIKAFLKDIPGELHQKPWINFEHNRNEALQLARKKANYILTLDADEYLSFSPNFSWPILDKGCYFCKVKTSPYTEFLRILLIQDTPDWTWQGVLHETLANPHPQTSVTLEGVENIALPNQGNRSQDPQKFLKEL